MNQRNSGRGNFRPPRCPTTQNGFRASGHDECLSVSSHLRPSSPPPLLPGSIEATTILTPGLARCSSSLRRQNDRYNLDGFRVMPMGCLRSTWTRLYAHRRITGVYGPRHKGMRCDASQPENSAFTNTNPRRHDALRCYPGVRSNNNRLDDQIKGLLAPVMATGAEVRALRHTDMIAETDLRQVINPYIFSNPAMVADGQTPRELHTYTGFENHTLPDTRAKQSK